MRPVDGRFSSRTNIYVGLIVLLGLATAGVLIFASFLWPS